MFYIFCFLFFLAYLVYTLSKIIGTLHLQYYDISIKAVQTKRTRAKQQANHRPKAFIQRTCVVTKTALYGNFNNATFSYVYTEGAKKNVDAF